MPIAINDIFMTNIKPCWSLNLFRKYLIEKIVTPQEISKVKIINKDPAVLEKELI